VRNTELAEIRDLPLFRTMDEDNFLSLTQAAYDQTFPAQVQLIEEGATADFLHVVMEGSVELFATWQGHETKLRTARERLAAYILRQVRSRGNGAGFTLPVEKRLLASYLGVTPESLSRLMKSLQDCGVHIEGQRITLTDPALLAEVAKPDALLDGPDPAGPSIGLGLPDCDLGTAQPDARRAVRETP
jgi:CRP-like cAMP-binding protein